MSFGKLAKDFHRCLRNIHSFSDKQAHVLDWDSEGLKWLRIQLRPRDGPYQSGMFDFLLHFGSHYPLSPPSVTCMTTIYHPNIDPESSELNVCLNLLDEWQATFGIEDIIQGLLFLLKNPNLEDPLSPYFDPGMDEEEFLDNVMRSIRGETLEDVSMTFMNVCVSDVENRTEVTEKNEVNASRENAGDKEDTDVGENKSADVTQSKDGDVTKGGWEENVLEIISVSDVSCDVASSETECSVSDGDSQEEIISLTSTESDDTSLQSVLDVSDKSDDVNEQNESDDTSLQSVPDVSDKSDDVNEQNESDESDTDSQSNDDEYDEDYIGLVKTESEQLHIKTEKQLAAIYCNMLNKVEKIVDNLKDEDFIEPETKDEDGEWEESEEDTDDSVYSVNIDSEESRLECTDSPTSSESAEHQQSKTESTSSHAGLQLLTHCTRVTHTDPQLDVPLLVMASFVYTFVRNMLRS